MFLNTGLLFKKLKRHQFRTFFDSVGFLCFETVIYYRIVKFLGTKISFC